MEINTSRCTISLLSDKEYEWFKEGIPPVSDWWWLRSPGKDGPRSMCVIVSNSLTENKCTVEEYYISVRPVVISTEKFPGSFIGNVLNIGYNETPFVYLGRYQHNHYYLCVKCIGKHRFDLDSNDWEICTLNKWLKKWWEKENEKPETVV